MTPIHTDEMDGSVVAECVHLTQRIPQKLGECHRRHLAGAHLELGMAFERDKQFDAARKKYLDVAKLFPNTDLSKQAIDRLRYLP